MSVNAVTYRLHDTRGAHGQIDSRAPGGPKLHQSSDRLEVWRLAIGAGMTLLDPQRRLAADLKSRLSPSHRIGLPMHKQVRSKIGQMWRHARAGFTLAVILVSSWSVAHAQSANSRPTKESPPHLNQKLEQIQRSFNSTASREKLPYRLDKVECGGNNQPVCVYRVLEGGNAHDRLLVFGYGTSSRNLAKVTLLFMNNEAADTDAFTAMLTFAVFVRLFSPDLNLEGRGDMVRTLVEGFAQNGEQSITVSGITYRTTRATAKGGLLFVIQRGEV